MQHLSFQSPPDCFHCIYLPTSAFTRLSELEFGQGPRPVPQLMPKGSQDLLKLWSASVLLGICKVPFFTEFLCIIPRHYTATKSYGKFISDPSTTSYLLISPFEVMSSLPLSLRWLDWRQKSWRKSIFYRSVKLCFHARWRLLNKQALCFISSERSNLLRTEQLSCRATSFLPSPAAWCR